MTTTYDLIPEGKIGRSISRYVRGVSNPNDSYAIKIDFIDSGLDTSRDCVRFARTSDIASSWAGDPFMPLRTVAIDRLGGGQGYRTMRYDSRVTHRTTATNVLLAEYEPQTISLEWWENFTTGAINQEWDETQAANVPTPWVRKVDVIHILIPTLLNANPIGSVDGMIDKTNDDNFEIDGVTYAANTLRFHAPESLLAKMPDGSTQRKVVYHYTARADGWLRQYRNADTGYTTADMFDRTTFTNPPYNG